MIELVKGSDPRLVVTLQQKDESGTIMPLNITSEMTVKCVYRDMIGKKEKPSSDPAHIEIADAVYGVIFVNFTDAETEKFKIGNFDFDIHVTEGSKNLIWKFIGECTVVDRIR